MSNRLFRATRLGLLLAAANALLLAEGPRLGLTAGAVWPTGATRTTFTHSAGYNLGAFADWEQRPGHILRLALDGNFHPKGDGDSRAQSQSLTLNYVFNPRADLQGFYLVLGGGAMNFQIKNDPYLKETGLKLAWNAGFGVDLGEKWGILARYHSLCHEGRNLGTVTAGLTYKF